MARCGSASALVATLWADHHLPLAEVLDAPAPVFAALVQIVELRHRHASRAEKRRRHQQDMQAAAQMHAALDGRGF